MDKAARDAFQNQTQAAFADADPGTIVIDGGTPIACGVTVGPREVELEKGGVATLQALTASVSKSDLADRPKRGVAVVYNGATYEIYNVAGDNATRWLLHAATFPAKL